MRARMTPAGDDLTNAKPRKFKKDPKYMGSLATEKGNDVTIDEWGKIPFKEAWDVEDAKKGRQ